MLAQIQMTMIRNSGASTVELNSSVRSDYDTMLAYTQDRLNEGKSGQLIDNQNREGDLNIAM